MKTQDIIGWINEDSTLYHNGDCPRLGPDRREVSVEEALAKQLSPCPECKPLPLPAAAKSEAAPNAGSGASGAAPDPDPFAEFDFSDEPVKGGPPAPSGSPAPETGGKPNPPAAPPPSPQQAARDLLHEILRTALRAGSSAIHLKAGLPPIFRIDGELYPYKEAPRLSPDRVNAMAFAMMAKREQDRFRNDNDLALGYSVIGLGRFRVYVFQQRGTIGVTLKPCSFPQTLEQLNLPAALGRLALEREGLIVVCGAGDSGKTTTAGALVDLINSCSSRHILTLSNVIEILHRDKKSLVDQREIGFDVPSFARAARGMGLMDAEVVHFEGCRDDFEAWDRALYTAQSGRLVILDTDARSIVAALKKIHFIFPPYQHQEIASLLAEVLRAVVYQALLPAADGRKRAPALELLINTPEVAEAIRSQRLQEIPGLIRKGKKRGMIEFEGSLRELVRKKTIAFATALAFSRDPKAMQRWRLQEPEPAPPEPAPLDPGNNDLEIERF